MKRLIIGVVLLFVVGCSSSSHNTTIANPPDVENCGVERWLVKILADADTSLVQSAPVTSSVTAQCKLPRVTVGNNDTRRSDERQVYSISAVLHEYKLEEDGDIHLVMRDPVTDSTMVAEIPNPDCPEVKATSRSLDYGVCRSWIETNIGKLTTSFKTADRLVTITGVGYYDQNHGQRGKAYNNREIHPVLTLK